MIEFYKDDKLISRECTDNEYMVFKDNKIYSHKSKISREEK